MKDFRAPIPRARASTDHFVAHYPPRDEVQSRYRLQIDVEAADADEAAVLAGGIADKLLVSMTLVGSGAHYHAELRKLRVANDAEEVSNYSEVIRVAVLHDPTQLDREDLSRISNMFDLVQRDQTANSAYVHIVSAWRLHSTPGSRSLERSILQHYILCMETVVNDVMKKLRSPLFDQKKQELIQFARQFSQELPKKSDQPEAIREAARTLEKISETGKIPSIVHVANFLGIEKQITSQAKDLYRFRSRSVSHPGVIKQTDLDLWLKRGRHVSDICLADRIARSFLEKYCGSKLNS